LSDDKAIGFDLICEGCRYNLRGLKDGGRCPECGKAIDLHAIVRRLAKPKGRNISFRRFNRLSAFDRFCMFLAFLLAVPLLVFGTVGIITGFYVRLSLPPILGVLPALAAWGTLRAILVALRVARSDPPAAPFDLGSLPSIYRDPVPRTISDIDAEVERRAIETENEALLSKFIVSERDERSEMEAEDPEDDRPTRSSGSA
jgi:hypothetical protein